MAAGEAFAVRTWTVKHHRMQERVLGLLKYNCDRSSQLIFPFPSSKMRPRPQTPTPVCFSISISGSKTQTLSNASLIIAPHICLIILYIITEENNLPIKNLMAAI